MRVRAFLAIAALFPALLLSQIVAAAAETNRLRIAQQFGIGYLPLIVAKEQKLIEKHAVSLGLPATEVTWLQMSGAAAMNDSLISGGLDFATAGVAPAILTRDKTRGRMNITLICSLGSMPNILVSNNPAVKTIKDFTSTDRIALPSVKVGFQPIVLQIAAEKTFGQYDKLDSLTVSLPHPDAAAAILSGAGGITAHFSSPPFMEQELESGKAHAVLNSYDVLGGPHTFNVVYATEKFTADNPKTVAAFVDALDEANSWIKANPTEAAKLYVAAEHSKLAPDFIERIIRDPQIDFTTVPERVDAFADFEFRIGLIKEKPTWKELFQPGLHAKNGS
ncbi:NitT/TauT family transport system substrate-binding protein [Arboricoccus pini]|uniref:NitT/TauT family transport system substrate-binding protein n=1 Tax=Arboricoccus pini TaxID=1963835 RepID=A0A212RF12_9PROT|nr:ABC transporter substrate-binding protein [Arboricoccus pini]SNB70859.1 NitT/TauT family transport system substrate-binding protein [Arboricoccus pini]